MNQKLLLPFDNFKKELLTLKNALDKAESLKETEYYEYLKDSVIQRFEYTSEGAWKVIRVFIKEIQGEETIVGPKEILKLGFKYGYIDDLKIWFDIIDLRNRTSHDYSSIYSNKSYNNIHNYYKYLERLLEKLTSIYDGLQ